MQIKFIEMKGKDARDFLHRITTADLRKIVQGQGVAALLLTGVGKVLADFFILNTEDNEFLLATEATQLDDLYADLEAMHFGESFTLDRSAKVGAILESKLPFTRPFNLSGAGHELNWPMPILGYSGVLTDAKNSISDVDWNRARILSRVPALGFEWQRGETNALDCGFLPWIDRAKGCYPGQEAVERALNVGHPARALVLLEGDYVFSPGDALTNGSICGKITSVAPRAEQNGCVALAIVQWAKREAAEFLVEGKGVLKCLK